MDNTVIESFTKIFNINLPLLDFDYIVVVVIVAVNPNLFQLPCKESFERRVIALTTHPMFYYLLSNYESLMRLMTALEVFWSTS